MTKRPWWLGLAVVLAGCGGSPPPARSNIAVQSFDAGGPDLTDVVYADQASDDALRRLLSTPAQSVLGWGLVIDSPSSQGALPVAPPAAFAFRHMTAEHRQLEPRRFQRVIVELGALLGPERLAHAHGTPFNGTGTLLVVTDATGARRLRVFTGDSTFTPDAAQWATLSAGQQPLTLTLTWADFDDNRIPDGYGPFVGGSVQFQIAQP